ncbi:MAG: biotin/lipoyl-containing protein, partial [Solirubrobacteraceae bacterium]
MADFLMPSLGADMESGTLLEWRVQPGDAVKRGDIVAVVDTSKAEIEVEIFEDGVIEQLLVPEGTKVPVGTALATLRGGAGEKAPAPTTPPVAVAPVAVQPVSSAAVATPPVATPPTSTPPHPSEGHRPRISPLARRMAERLDVDLAAVA